MTTPLVDSHESMTTESTLAVAVDLTSARMRAMTTEYGTHFFSSGLVLTVGPADRHTTAARHVWTRREILETLSMRLSQELISLKGGDSQMSLREVDA